MKCPKCEYENREGAKFCRECGGALEQICPQCKHHNEPDATFCDECGANGLLSIVLTGKELYPNVCSLSQCQ